LAGLPGGSGSGRLTLMLSAPTWRETPWAEALPRVLEPLGVISIRAATARHAERVLRTTRVHMAVVDMGVPLADESDHSASDGGSVVLEMLARLEQAPATVVVKSPTAVRDEQRSIAAALRCNAFAVVDRTAVDLEVLLSLLKRALSKHYQDKWPGCGKMDNGLSGGGVV
jgi:hypothetical protein